MSGAKMNWKNAYANINHPPIVLALLKFSPVNSIIKSGITGIIIPMPMTSSNKVMKIKPTAAFLLFFKTSNI